jgi:hypothetical protein
MDQNYVFSRIEKETKLLSQVMSTTVGLILICIQKLKQYVFC